MSAARSGPLHAPRTRLLAVVLAIALTAAGCRNAQQMAAAGAEPGLDIVGHMIRSADRMPAHNEIAGLVFVGGLGLGYITTAVGAAFGFLAGAVADFFAIFGLEFTDPEETAVPEGEAVVISE